MKYVIDSSVAVKWVLPEAASDKAEAIRSDFRRAVHELLAPDIFSVEAAHALTRAERQLRISVGSAKILFLDILTTQPTLFPFQPLMLRAIDISSQMRVGVYDCVYVALAERENCKLVTADDGSSRICRARFRSSLHLRRCRETISRMQIFATPVSLGKLP